jgi:hypothetical protein
MASEDALGDLSLDSIGGMVFMAALPFEYETDVAVENGFDTFMSFPS